MSRHTAILCDCGSADYAGYHISTCATVVDVMTQKEPPQTCPYCNNPVESPVKDDEGKWTWNCKEGCNP